MTRRLKQYLCYVLILIGAGMSGCATPPKPAPIESALHYIPQYGDQQIDRHAPIFWVEEPEIDFNRIGTVRATAPDNVFVDPDSPTLYAEQRQFATEKGTYTNLIYRVHFQKIPSTFSPYYLGAGKNIGLFVIVTLGEKWQPLLYTTVHTCGCYLSFTPTSLLAKQAFPEGWSRERQSVYGESLPSYLDYAGADPQQQKIQIRIRPGTHRVMDLWLNAADTTPAPTVTIPLKPLAALEQLPIETGRTTSFYETSGSRTGHVKGSYKFRERLFMSWWALDWNVGQDKKLGSSKDEPPIFNTSLKPWAWDASDMRDFATFLHYWGWDL
jgi:hypothetical protein